MRQIDILSKILQIRENEKKAAEIEHSQAIDEFEDVAQKLYGLLRKKENIEEKFSQATEKKMSIDMIRIQSKYIEKLYGQILRLQNQVNQARKNMEQKRHLLTNAHIEVKKFEKMIEHRQREHQQQVKKEENNDMDEISVQQYFMTIR